jgi:hypothetical protein
MHFNNNNTSQGRDFGGQQQGAGSGEGRGVSRPRPQYFDVGVSSSAPDYYHHNENETMRTTAPRTNSISQSQRQYRQHDYLPLDYEQADRGGWSSGNSQNNIINRAAFPPAIVDARGSQMMATPEDITIHAGTAAATRRSFISSAHYNYDDPRTRRNDDQQHDYHSIARSQETIRRTSGSGSGSGFDRRQPIATGISPVGGNQRMAPAYGTAVAEARQNVVPMAAPAPSYGDRSRPVPSYGNDPRSGPHHHYDAFRGGQMMPSSFPTRLNPQESARDPHNNSNPAGSYYDREIMNSMCIGHDMADPRTTGRSGDGDGGGYPYHRAPAHQMNEAHGSQSNRELENKQHPSYAQSHHHSEQRRYDDSDRSMPQQVVTSSNKRDEVEKYAFSPIHDVPTNYQHHQPRPQDVGNNRNIALTLGVHEVGLNNQMPGTYHRDSSASSYDSGNIKRSVEANKPAASTA